MLILYCVHVHVGAEQLLFYGFSSISYCISTPCYENSERGTETNRGTIICIFVYEKKLSNDSRHVCKAIDYIYFTTFLINQQDGVGLSQ